MKTKLALLVALLLALTACDPNYRTCADAREAGAAPLKEGDPGYSRELDRDGDGVACDSP